MTELLSRLISILYANFIHLIDASPSFSSFDQSETRTDCGSYIYIYKEQKKPVTVYLDNKYKLDKAIPLINFNASFYSFGPEVSGEIKRRSLKSMMDMMTKPQMAFGQVKICCLKLSNDQRGTRGSGGRTCISHLTFGQAISEEFLMNRLWHPCFCQNGKK